MLLCIEKERDACIKQRKPENLFEIIVRKMKARKSHAINDDLAIDPVLDGQCVQISMPTNFGVSFLVSGVLSIIFKTMTAPLERIKLILQTQASSHQIGASERSAYKGFIDAMVRIPREQGFFSLWRGNFLNICRYFPAQAINFSFYNVYHGAYQRIIQPRTNFMQHLISFLAGGSVGVTSCVILYPLSFCITRIAVDVGDSDKVKRQFRNLNDCWRKVYKIDGYKGVYQGMVCSAGGMFLYRSIYFGAYTFGKHWYVDQRAKGFRVSPVLMSLVFAQSASIAATLISYPLDTISKQKMLHSGQLGPRGYETIRQVVARIVETDGLAGFYKGILTNLLTTVCGSCILVTYDLVITRFPRKFEDSESPDMR
ncbi:ADP/ATP translocase 2 isoform X2 [Megalopta genalis]|uniref:ADP/ATP translocase 2 isoform X2 n=1 Tax=Megalopta genalis TaxID=115081 RepID=UPI003FD3AC49